MLKRTVTKDEDMGIRIPDSNSMGAAWWWLARVRPAERIFLRRRAPQGLLEEYPFGGAAVLADATKGLALWYWIT